MFGLRGHGRVLWFRTHPGKPGPGHSRCAPRASLPLRVRAISALSGDCPSRMALPRPFPVEGASPLPCPARNRFPLKVSPNSALDRAAPGSGLPWFPASPETMLDCGFTQMRSQAGGVYTPPFWVRRACKRPPPCFSKTFSGFCLTESRSCRSSALVILEEPSCTWPTRQRKRAAHASAATRPATGPACASVAGQHFSCTSNPQILPPSTPSRRSAA